VIDVEHLNRTFPKYPITVSDKGWVYGVWYCSTAWMRTHFHGQYPLTFLKRVLALFPTAKNILHCPSGTITGPGVTVDLIRDENRKPQVLACATELPFKAETFDLYISDPPYSKADSQRYGTPPFKSKVAMEEARRVLKPGGHYALLNIRYPSFQHKHWKFVGLIGVVTGANRVARILSIFQKAMLLLVCMCAAGAVQGATVGFSWTEDVNTNVLYRLHYGPAPRGYTNGMELGYCANTMVTLGPGTYYFALTAYNAKGESGFSNELVWTAPDQLRLVSERSVDGVLWEPAGTNLVDVARPIEFWRLRAER
jgi:hypothetical protein